MSGFARLKRELLKANRAVSALATLVLWFALLPAANAASFTVSFDRNIIVVGESVTLLVTFENGAPRQMPSLPTIPGLNVAYPPSQSTQMQLSGGVRTTSVIYQFRATPEQPGEYIVPAMNAQVGDQTLSSVPVKLTVLNQGSPVPAAEIKTAFIKLIVPKTNVYLGEILPVDIHVCFQAAQGSEAPRLKEEGFTLGKFDQGQQRLIVTNGQRFNLVPLRTYVIPAKTGQLNLGPATMALRIPRANSRVNLFGEPVDWENVTLQSDPQSLQVLPLPSENVPPGFSGAVGNYSMSVSANPTNIAVGDPVTVTVQISGRGAFDALTLPAQTGWEQFKLYPPTTEFQPAPNDALGITGAKTFKLTAVPGTTDIKALPLFAFGYFDPDQKSYRVLTQPAVPLTVRPSFASLPPPITSGNPTETTSTNNGIAHIKPLLGTVGQIQPPLVRRSWFIALQVVPVLAWLSLLVYRRQQDKLAGNPRLRRQRLVDQIVRNNLKDLRLAAETNQADEFFAILFRLLQEQLGERLDLPASAITEAVLDERLRPLGVPEETLRLLRELFHACNQARYARQTTNDELVSVIPTVEHVLKELKRLKG